MKKNRFAPRVPVATRDPKKRIRDFAEVSPGYTLEEAQAESRRCLQCKRPHCVQGCPVQVQIPAFISAITSGDIGEAYRIIRHTNSLPAVCGRVCPQEHQCEGHCVLGRVGEPVAIGRLERFAADTALSGETAVPEASARAPERATGLPAVACLGAGPASLTAAGYLAARGFSVTIFEALHEAGGVLCYGIPEFRLPKHIVHQEISGLKKLGVRFVMNAVGGKSHTLDDLFRQGFGAIFIGVGAGLPRFPGVRGENIAGVFSANEYLTRINLGKAFEFPDYDTPPCLGKNVTVFGGGNVAVDAARTALRMHAESVRIVYRRTLEELPARREEVEHALEEGIIFDTLLSPCEFLADERGFLRGVRLQEMRLEDKADASGRRRVAALETIRDMVTDLAIIAMGTSANPVLLANTPRLALDKRGYIKIDEETGQTSIPGVYAGGDIVSGAATVIEAMGAGRRAAKSIEAAFLDVKG